MLATAPVLPAAAQPATKTMRIALRDDPDVLDPTFARTYTGRLVFAALCDKLFDIDEKLTIVPSWPPATSGRIRRQCCSTSGRA